MAEIKQTGSLDLRSAKAAKDTAINYTDSSINDIQIGGRNLLLWSSPSSENLAKIATPSSTNSVATEDGYTCYKITGASTNGPQYRSNGKNLIQLEANTTYTYSAWVKITTTETATNTPFNFTHLGHFTVYNSASTASDPSHEDVASNRIFSPAIVEFGKWIKIQITFTTNALSGSWFGVYPKHTLGDTYTLFIRNQKLERGNKATDWSPAPEDVNADISSVSAVANAAASKATAIKRTQRIYYRSNSSTKPTTPGTASSNWVTWSEDADATWTTMHVSITSTNKYIYTCEQSETNAGVVSYTTVLRDNTITVIDGGNIITGTVTANQLSADSINASNMLTIGSMTTSTQDAIDNSNVVVGGRNLVLETGAPATSAASASNSAYTTSFHLSNYGDGVMNNTDDDWYCSFDYVIEGNSSSNVAIYFQFHGSATTANTGRTLSGNASGRVSETFKLTSEQVSSTVRTCRFRMQYATDGAKFTVTNFKLEKGNRATDWTPAPEDISNDISTVQTAAANAQTTADNAQANIDNLEIGGRNLLLGTKDWSTVSYSTTGTHSFDGTYNDCTVLKFIGSGSGYDDIWFANKHTVQLEADAYYVCSFWAKAADENTWIVSYFYNPNSIDSSYNSSGYSSTGSDGITRHTIGTTWKRYWVVWHIKSDATSFPRTLIIARHNNSSGTLWIAGVKLEKGTKPTGWTQAPEEVDNKIDTTYDKIRSQGIQLVTNGNGFMGDNTNWPSLTFDGAKSNNSPGSFTKSAAQSEIASSELIPIDLSKEYLFEFDAMSSDGTARLYSFLNFFDVDKQVISAQTVMYYYSTLTTLAQDLNPGDTTVKLTSAANWYSSSTAHQRSLIFWDYTNSYGYTYPPNTYSRNFYYNIYADDSKVDKATGVITLKSAWTGPKKTAGTYVSQNHSGSSYNYAHVYVLIPATWTHFSFKYSGLDLVQDGTDGAGKFRQGTAFAKIGFLWNYGASTSSPQGQIWVTNVSLKEDTATSSELSAVSEIANAAAPKTTAIKRTQRIYYRSNSSTKPTTPGTASSNWVTQSGDVSSAWTTMHVPITDTYKYIYTCEQSETNAGVVGYTTVLRDNTITVIDGGNIITGTVSANAVNASSGTFNTANIPALTADHIKANVISAVNSGTGTINADKINAGSLSIGYSQITNPPTIPTQSSIDNAAKTATNYISASSNGIKISDSNPESATTYQQLTSTSTEFITNGISTLYIGSESNVSIIRVGSSTKGNIVLSGDGYVDIRSGSNIISHFGYESLYGEDDGSNPRVKSNYPYYTLGTRYNSSSYSIGGFSVTLGKDCIAEEWCSVAMGYSAWASGYRSISLSGHSTGAGSLSICPNSLSSGTGSIAIGNSSQATSSYSMAIGHYAKATGSYAHAFGYYTEARGEKSIVGGDHSNAYADESIAIGHYCNTDSNASYSVALGYNSGANSEYQTVIGKNNVLDTNGTYAFIIGGGSTSTSRKNIFTVDWSGNVVCKDLTCNSLNKVNDTVMIDRQYPSSGAPSNSVTTLGTSIGGLYDRLYIEATDSAGNTKWIMLKGPFVNGTTYQFNITITGADKDVGLVFRTKTFSITTSSLKVVTNSNGDYKYGRATISNSGVSSWSYSNEVHITKVIGVRI